MAEINDATQNVTLYDESGNPVNVILDGGIYRLAVEAKLVDSDLTFQLQAFVPVVNTSIANLALTASYQTLLEVTTTQGKLDFIAIAGSGSTYQVKLTIDGTMIFELPMSTLSTIGLSNATNVPMWAETADKNFRYHPRDPVDFTTGFKLEAKLISGSPTINWLIAHRAVA